MGSAILPVLVCLALPAIAQNEAASPRDKMRDIRDLARQGSGVIARLQAYLTDPVVEVRVEAVKAIVALGTQRSLEPLVQATRDNDAEIQLRATDGLVNFYLPGYVDTGFSATLRRAGKAIRGRWTDTNDQVIDPFIQVRPEVIDALGKLARGGMDMTVRANAARAVGVLRGRAAIPDLIEALRSKDDRVLYESLVALQKIRDPGAAEKIAFLLRDFNEKVQIAAIETTGLLQNKEALPRLREALGRARSAAVRRAALTAIAMLPDPSSRDLYSQYFNDKDDAMRAAAAEGFARLKNPADLPAIEKAFSQERKTNARLSQAFAMVSLGKKELSEFSALQYLINTLNSRSWRGVAQPFLVELTRDAEVRQAVYRAVPGGTRDEKMLLAQVLARSGDRDTVPVLEQLSRDTDLEVAQAGLRALRTLRARL